MKMLLPLALGLLLASCSTQGDPCVTNDDCFRGEVCIEGFCGAPVDAVDGGVEDPSDRDAAVPDRDSENSDPDANNGADGGVRGDGGAGPDGGVDAGPTGACFFDPFEPCEDDEDPRNNSFPGAYFDPMTRGCQPSGFVPLDKTISGRQCPLDPEDQYTLTVVECDADEPGMVIELTLDVKDDCDPDTIWFDVEAIGTSCAEPNPDSDIQIRCETLATGERKITTIWPGQSRPVVASIRWSIQTPDRNDIAFDYDLRAVVREP